MQKQLNDFEVLTLIEAYSRIVNNNEYRINVPSPFKKCKQNLPVLISEKLINVDTLKYTGMIVLTDKGKEKAKILFDAV